MKRIRLAMAALIACSCLLALDDNDLSARQIADDEAKQQSSWAALEYQAGIATVADIKNALQARFAIKTLVETGQHELAKEAALRGIKVCAENEQDFDQVRQLYLAIYEAHHQKCEDKSDSACLPPGPSPDPDAISQDEAEAVYAAPDTRPCFPELAVWLLGHRAFP